MQTRTGMHQGMPNRFGSRRLGRPWLAAAIVVAMAAGTGCTVPDLPESGAQLFVSPQIDPIALSEDGTTLYVANTTTGTLSVLDVTGALPSLLAEIKVGHDPTGVGVLPGGVDGDELVFVVNHGSDSVQVVSRDRLAVVQTLTDLDAEGVTRMNEPVAISFASATRAFVTLDEPNQVLVLDVDETGRASINPTRLAIPAQAPRALTVAGGKLYVAPFESLNQTEMSTCWPYDVDTLGEPDGPFPQALGVTEDDTTRTDEGCDFSGDLVADLNLEQGLILGTVFTFAAVNPNIGGRVVRDTDIPDRDLFRFDAQTLVLEQVVDTVGTMLNGMAASSDGGVTRLYVSHTEANNHLDGLRNLDNKLFDNRLAILDCDASGCGAPALVDLDGSAASLGRTVPNPYGIRVSGDGQTVVVTAQAADGDPGDGRAPMHGLFTLDRDGNVQGSALVGALPEGVALRSAPDGSAQTAYVLNTADSTVSVVDVSNPLSPAPVGVPVVVGQDPTPEDVRLGRIAFHTARASTSRTFACGMCHPNGNIDQLVWTINTVNGPEDGPMPNGEIAEPRTTMPIRGLRDTLPLHWEGVLSDPIALENPLAPFDTAPDCDLEVDGEIGCIRHLVDAALSGPMCQHNVPGGCQPDDGQLGPDGTNKPGALTETERDAMAAFQAAVAFPNAPNRRPTDRLSEMANLGVSDFFTNEDDKGINDGVGQVIDFAPTTCADNPMGCHSLPLTVSTNSSVVGGFDVPSARGMWDRVPLFSNGIFSSEEILRGAQACADGIEPLPKAFQVELQGNPIDVTLEGDPCNLNSPLLEFVFGFPLAEVPFPSGEHIYDPAEGFTERGNFIATFEGLFTLVYGVRGDAIWEFQEEIGTGLPGLAGHQLELTADNAADAGVGDMLAMIEKYAGEGRVTAVATGYRLGEMRFDPTTGVWSTANGWNRTGDQLRDLAAVLDAPITITCDLPGGISIGGADRQPLLDIDPDVRAIEENGDAPNLPAPYQNEVATFTLDAQYVDADGSILVNGDLCESCSMVAGVAPETGRDVIEVTLDPGLPAGVHVMQVLNGDGWQSNEMPLCVTNVRRGDPLPPFEDRICLPGHSGTLSLLGDPCPEGEEVVSCDCQGGADGFVEACGPNFLNRRCTASVLCLTGTDPEGDCLDSGAFATCGPVL